MINFIYGTYGSGKTSAIIDMLAADAKSGIRSFLLVPDQEALQFERLTLSKLPASSQLSLEILGFSRLYNRVCREYGNLSYSYMTKPMRSLLMWKALNELNGLFSELGTGLKNRYTDMTATELMLDTISEFKMNAISPAALEMAAKKLPTDSVLHRRLRDLAMLYALFDNYVSEKYSDSADDLSRLRDVLKEHRFFNGTNVYIDSFTSFTAVQHQIIEYIFRDAENVTITIPLSSPKSNDISSMGVELSHEKLLKSAERCGNYTSTVLERNKRASSPAIAFLSENIWKMDASSLNAPSPEGSIIIEKCDTPYAESEAVASHILDLLRKGARCRDIAIIARDCEKYRGILDTALKKSEIPFYFTPKSELCAMPSVKFILSALRIKKYNWQKLDVISHIKTGLCDISPTDANLFEEYVNTWNIHGEQFLADSWTMNPDGFVDELTPRANEILIAANRVRKIITEPLTKLFVRLDASENVADMCRSLFDYTVDVSLEKKLASLAQKAALRKELKQASELSKIYGIMLQTLADIAEVIGDECVDTEEFILILKNSFDNTEIGTIPTSIDEVTIGSADTLRASKTKYAFVIGLCEGEFPASVGESGIFTVGERETLCELGIELAGNSDIYSSNELMYVQRAFAVPSEKLFVFTHTSELGGIVCFPSLAFNRIEKLFGHNLTHIYKLSDIDYLTPAVKNAAGLLRSLPNGEKKVSLCQALGEYIPELSTLSELPSTEDKCEISRETVKNALGDSLRLSATSFEKYVNCPFNYFCSNVLKLREKKDSVFKANDIGSFVHYVLETLVKYSIPDQADALPPNDAELIALANKTVTTYLQKICPQSLINSKRLQHLYTRLKQLSLLLVRNTIKEFSASDFRPVFYELRANGKDGNPSPLIFKLSDGAEAYFSGVIDRVDLYRDGDNVYIRVVDYKTGKKTFSLKDIDNGINLQMLIYLFTLCRSRSSDFKRSIGLSADGKAIPAGVMYLSSYIPTIEATDYDTNGTVTQIAEDSLSRTGLLLNDEDVLFAMNKELDSRFLAGIKRGKDDKLTGSALVTQGGFVEIFEKLQNTVIKIAGELHAGKADANPLIYDNKSPCEHCASKPICRKQKK